MDRRRNVATSSKLGRVGERPTIHTGSCVRMTPRHTFHIDSPPCMSSRPYAAAMTSRTNSRDSKNLLYIVAPAMGTVRWRRGFLLGKRLLLSFLSSRFFFSSSSVASLLRLRAHSSIIAPVEPSTTIVIVQRASKKS